MVLYRGSDFEILPEVWELLAQTCFPHKDGPQSFEEIFNHLELLLAAAAKDQQAIMRKSTQSSC